MKKLILYTLAFVLLGALPGMRASGTALPGGFPLALSNERLALYADEASGQVILEDRASGYLWYSNPQGNDSRAKGIHRQTLLSQLTLSFANERGTGLTITSAADAVNAGGLHLRVEGDSLVATYDFAKPRIRVMLVYRLAEDHLKVSVPMAGIECYADEEGNANLNTVTAVDVLPLLGAGGLHDEGFLLVPDGAGAKINFNNGVTSMMEYSASVYGKDHGVEGQIGLTGALQAQARTIEQTARLPVFGIYHENAGDARALLSIVTQNEAKAAILARVSNLTSYNYAWSRFRVRNAGSMMMNSKEFGASVIGVSEREGLTVGEYEVRYYPLAGQQASTVGMAATYRAYLQSERGLAKRVSEGQYPLYLELYGQVDKPAQLLGIPYTKTYTLTTLADIQRIVQALPETQPVVRYAHWTKEKAFGAIPSRAELASRLGSSADLAPVHQQLAAQGGALFPAVDLMNVYQGGRGFWAIRDAVLAPVNAPQLQFELSWSSRAVNPNYAPWYLLSPARYTQFYTRYYQSFNKLGLPGLALDAAGQITTSDMRSSGGTGRGQVPALVQDILRKADKQLMITGGNDYAAALASHLLSAPGTSSGYTLTDEALPFFQMVFHGYVPYGIGILNHAANPQEALLRCLEYGASPQYAFVGQNAQEVAESRLNFLFSPDFDAWQEEVQEGYHLLAQVLAPLVELPITGHTRLPFGARTEYGGRTAVYVNYSPQDVAHEGLQIPAQGFAVQEVAHEQP